MAEAPQYLPWQRLRDLRMEANLTCEQLAVKIGRTLAFVYQMEVGLRRPGLNTMHDLAAVFDLSYRELADSLPPAAPGRRNPRALAEPTAEVAS